MGAGFSYPPTTRSDWYHLGIFIRKRCFTEYRQLRTPQAILIDLDLLDINYSILSRRIKLIDSNIGTVGIASSLPQESLEARNTSQINLIVHKKDSIEEIIRAVGSVSNHPKLMHWTSKDQASPLSKKELQIIRMTARGFTYAAIGRQLHISEQTVKTYIRRSYIKLGVHTRSECVALCSSQGWLI